MNLKNVGSYSIGLDLGTNSVGWAVIDENGDLCRKSGKPTWGSRLFSAGNPASEARAPRGQRRRYVRRRWRLDLLQEFFAEEMQTVDPDFFARLNQSRLLKGDKDEGLRDYRWPLFNGEYDEAKYYEDYPTIFHLREKLMSSDEKADIRLVYLALHNIVKHRGNFLQQDNTSLSAANADVDQQVRAFALALREWCEELETSGSIDEDQIVRVLRDKALSRAAVKERLISCISVLKTDDVDGKGLVKELAGAIIGYKAEFAKIFPGIECEQTKFALSDDESPDNFADVCADSDRAAALFEALRALYSAYVLMGILTKPGLSASKVAAYEQYGEDLAILKHLVKQYVPESYEFFFRGPLYEDKKDYDVSKAKGYTRYNLGVNKKGSGAKPMQYDDFKKEVVKLFAGTKAVDDPEYQRMMAAFEEERFLRRLRTSDNGQIPYQLHLEEMEAILAKQEKYYPFLKESHEKLCTLVSFRIPYYVGPLTQVSAAKGEDGSSRFAWSVRKEGKETEKVYPWNWDEVIDRHASAEAFIHRMTGTCTYLEGEPVLPKCSLLYEEFCVLNELNGSKWTQDGDREQRFHFEDRAAIFDELFSNKRSVKYKDVADWMRRKHGWSNVHVSGGQGETGYESKLASRIFFCKDIFGVDEFPEEHREMVENIILWSTLFEDRSILKEKIKMAYGDILNDDQIAKIGKKRFTGWGRLSKKLLTDLKVKTDCGRYSIMDVLREGDPNSEHPGRAMVFMEILRDDTLNFQAAIDDINREKKSAGLLTAVNELPGSPANRRTINQALRIVEEIAHIAGHAPDNVFVEVTRDDDMQKRGQRTVSRYRNIQQALNDVKGQFDAVRDELKQYDPRDFEDDRLVLYFMQGGKSMYSGAPLDIRRLSEYQVDHIIPQSYVKDDSLENRVLVKSEENQRKTDNLLIDESIRRRMASYWRALHDAKLIGDKKFNNLMCSSISEGRMKGFIARQIVETSQIVKMTQQMLVERYPEARVLPIRASYSHDLREECGFVKCREVNDFHHAHDAYLACQMGRFILKRHSAIYDNPIGMTAVLRGYIKKQGEQLKYKKRIPGQSGFLVQSFTTAGFDEVTGEIFKDDWDAGAEIARMRKCLNYRDCFVVRMPEETTGAFWDQTVYSPRINKKRLPLKEGLNPEDYGGYSGEVPAYFFIFKAMKKGKPTYFFEGVPLTIAGKVKKDPEALVGLAKQIAGPKFEDVEILRDRILRYQKIEYLRDAFILTSLDLVRIARPLVLKEDAMLSASRLDNEGIADSDLILLFNCLRKKISIICSRCDAVIVPLKANPDCFEEMGHSEKTRFLKDLLGYLNGSRERIDLSAFGGSKFTGGMSNGFLKKDLARVVFVDQSVTGMFETRTTLERL